MAVTANTPIKQSDMAALASAANAVVGTSRLGNSMNYPFGPPVYLPTGVSIYQVGSGYQVADTVAGPTTETFTVGAVSPTGGILGLVQTNPGTISPVNSGGGVPTSPFHVTGGSGTGCQINFTWTSMPMTQNYSFPDWFINKGIITQFYTVPGQNYTNEGVTINQGALGYIVGDVISIPTLPGLVMTLTAVNTGGVPATWTLSGTSYVGITITLPSNISGMATTGGSGTGFVVAGLYFIPFQPTWATELARLRTNLQAYIDNYGGDDFTLDGQPQLSVSGAISSPNVTQSNAWPCGGPQWNYHNQNFWFRDNGAASAVTVTVSCGFLSCAGKFTVAACTCIIDAGSLWSGVGIPGGGGGGTLPRLGTLNDSEVKGFGNTWSYVGSTGTGSPGWIVQSASGGLGTKFDAVQITKQDFEIVIGGATTATLTGHFIIYIEFQAPYTIIDGTITPDAGFNPTAMLTTPSGDSAFPGTLSQSYSAGLLTLTWTVSTSIAPGTYGVNVDLSSIPTTDEELAIVNIHRAARWNICAPGLQSSDAVFSFPFSGAVADNGIDNSKKTYRIAITDGGTAPFWMPFGLYGVNWLSLDTLGSDQPLVNASPTGYYGQFNATTGDQLGISTYDTPYTVPGTQYPPSGAWLMQTWPGGSVTQPTFLAIPFLYQTGWTATASVDGYWTALCPPIEDLYPCRPQDMPWNYQRTRAYSIGVVHHTYAENPMLLGGHNPDNVCASNTYDQGQPVEYQTSPARWRASVWITVGFTITDAKGQGLYQCTTAGYTGASEPTWFPTVGSVVNETGYPPAGGSAHSVSWTCIKARIKATTWAASTNYQIGSTIIDGNGNTQQAISGWNAWQTLPLGFTVCDSNNNQQTVTTAGRTGVTVPAWSTVLSGTTTDNGVVWTLTAIAYGANSNNPIGGPPVWPTVQGYVVTDNEVVWQLVTPIAETFATAPPRYGGQQPGPTPRWPVYWYSETIAALKPPVTSAETEVTVWGTGNQWQGDSFYGGTDAGFQTYATSPGGTGMMAGAFVYSITVNRISSPTGTVSVYIGCMRSGSFYSFGTYTTGQKYIVLWPIMTTDALVYQCSERVDIQAVVIARSPAGPGGACGTVSIALPDVDAPICAAHYNDTLALIGFVQ